MAITGVQIVLKIVRGTHIEGLAEDDFKFQALSGLSCSTETLADGTAYGFSAYACLVDTYGTTLTLTTQEAIIANRKYRIKVNVQNPPFASIRDLRVVT